MPPSLKFLEPHTFPRSREQFPPSQNSQKTIHFTFPSIEVSYSLHILIAIVSCHKFRRRADAQRSTWVPLVKKAQVGFFLGRGIANSPDEIILDVPDNYHSLPFKVQAMLKWAWETGYDYVFKTDDDVYIQPERLAQVELDHPYIGPSSMNKEPYASGFAHWLDRKAMEIVIRAEVDDWAEDRWTGKVLREAGINLKVDNRYTVVNSLDPQNPITGLSSPLKSNDIIASCEFTPRLMRKIHREWLDSNS